jgi:hypothetical protein
MTGFQKQSIDAAEWAELKGVIEKIRERMMQ